MVPAINMNAYHLRKSEILYELKIRGIDSRENVNELRKRLNQCFTANTPADEEIVNSLDSEEELEQCEEKSSDLISLVEDYEGDGTDNEYKRVMTRLMHLRMRVERIPIPITLDAEPELRKNELIKKVKEKMDFFEAILSAPPRIPPEAASAAADPPEVSQQDKKIEAETTHPLTALRGGQLPEETKQPQTSDTMIQQTPPASIPQTKPISVFPENVKMNAKAVPVYKWGLTFSNGPGESIGAFLERVEELRRARGLTESQLFMSAVDLFSGSVLVWYRSTIGRVKSWRELCNELKLVFRTPDYDDMLLKEIMNRSQGDLEPIDLFIASMEGLYQRLSEPVPESSKLRQILKNLNPYLQEKLCMFSISSMEELRQMGRKAELGRMRVTHNFPPPKPRFVLEPDLAYKQVDAKRTQPNAQVSYVNSRMPASQGVPFKCWNCEQVGHRYSSCCKPRTLFCYGCGSKNVKKSDCLNCKPKNV